MDLAGPLGVTHFFILTATSSASYLRVAKAPHGPTLALRIKSYALMRDVLASQARPRSPASAWAAPPLVVLQNFPGGGGGGDALAGGRAGPDGARPARPPVVGGGSTAAAAGLAAELFRSAFPPIDVRSARLSSCRRVVLLTYEGDGKLSLRHYSISATPAGVSPGVRALVARHALPKGAGDAADVADLLAAGSESEGEPDTRVTLATPLSRAGGAGGAARVRVHELGPRLEMEALKVEGGLCGGPVLFHAHEARSSAAVAAGDASAAGAARARAARRAAQEANVARKRAAAARAAAEKAAAGGKKGEGGGGPGGPDKKKKQWWEVEADDAEAHAARAAAAAAAADDDVAEYVRQVGEAPESLAGLSRARTARATGGRGRGGDGGGAGRGRGGGGRGGGRGRGGSAPPPAGGKRPAPPAPEGRGLKRGRR